MTDFGEWNRRTTARAMRPTMNPAQRTVLAVVAVVGVVLALVVLLVPMR